MAGTQREDFADFYRESKDECLFTVLLSVGDRETAQDLVAEAFARAWASWHKVSAHPAPRAWVIRAAFAGPVPARCPVYQAGQAQLHAIYQFKQGNGTAAVVIDPSAIPRGIGLFIMEMPAKYAEGQPPPFGVVGGQGVHIGVVDASGSCPLT
ncbi:MAG: hypothetical protein JO132_00100 [Streptosporangiaceae bacterium]|nr:hypothetical protein [Streptosporangiaceae bacterium]